MNRRRAAVLRLYERIEGPARFDGLERVEFYGLVRGTLTVGRDSNVRVLGTVTGDLRVEFGAHAEVFGMIMRSVITEGVVQLHGSVGGYVVERDDGVVVRHP